MRSSVSLNRPLAVLLFSRFYQSVLLYGKYMLNHTIHTHTHTRTISVFLVVEYISESCTICFCGQKSYCATTYSLLHIHTLAVCIHVCWPAGRALPHMHVFRCVYLSTCKCMHAACMCMIFKYDTTTYTETARTQWIFFSFPLHSHIQN